MTTFRKVSRKFLIGLAMTAIFISGACSSTSKDERKTARRGGPGSPVIVATAVQKDLPVQVKTIGKAEAYSTVFVKAQVGGEITRVDFREGQDVKKGNLLFSIDSRPYEIALKQATSLLEKDRALLKNAEGDVKRYKELVQKDYVTKEQYDQLIANSEVLVASVKADEASVADAKLQLERCQVRSPIDGRTGSLLIHPGNIIRANDTVSAVVIYQITPIYVAFSVPEQNLPKIKEFMAKGDLKVEAILSEINSAPIPGVLTFVDNSIDTATGTILLKATFPNKDQALWPGQFLNVALTLTTEKNVVVIPSQAIQTSQGGQYVFVVKDDLTAEMRPVKPDRSAGELTVVAEGLKPGEKVVTDGQLRLVPGARVEIKGTLEEEKPDEYF
jgi:multidrug efflux system membrane fusion protein